MEGGLNAEWVKREMPLYEAEDLIDAIEKKRRPSWEQARMVAKTIANTMGARLSEKDMQFPWDQFEDNEIEEAPDGARIREAKEKLKKLKHD